jgi:hypothetical protein
MVFSEADYRAIITASEKYPVGHGFQWGYGPLENSATVKDVLTENPEYAFEYG